MQSLKLDWAEEKKRRKRKKNDSNDLRHFQWNIDKFLYAFGSLLRKNDWKKWERRSAPGKIYMYKNVWMLRSKTLNSCARHATLAASNPYSFIGRKSIRKSYEMSVHYKNRHQFKNCAAARTWARLLPHRRYQLYYLRRSFSLLALVATNSTLCVLHRIE